jgi:hypothetical protein
MKNIINFLKEERTKIEKEIEDNISEANPDGVSFAIDTSDSPFDILMNWKRAKIESLSRAIKLFESTESNNPRRRDPEIDPDEPVLT